MLTVMVHAEHHIGTARRSVLEYCSPFPFSALEQAELAIIVTELATNLVKHTSGGGSITCQARSDTKGIDLVIRDTGPGIADITAALSDGNSTSGTMGGGLGAIRRLADCFHLDSTPAGTVILASKLFKQNSPKSLSICAHSRPHPESQVSGDDIVICEGADWTLIGVIDALGHGVQAHATAVKVKQSFMALHGLPLDELLRLAHQGLLASRGAVVSLACIHPQAGFLDYVALGNIDTRLITPNHSKVFFNQNGTLGLTLPPLQITRYPWTRESVLIIASDGIDPSWLTAAYPDLHTSECSATCLTILNEWGRTNDDATILAVRNQYEV